MKVLLIDNGSKLIEKLKLLIPGSEITKRWKDIIPSDTNDFDLIILSGSKDFSVKWDHADFIKEIKLIRETSKPIIGICFGCELIAYSFGGSIKELPSTHQGIRQINILDRDLIDKEIINVYEHHRWIIDVLPEDFTSVAESKDGIEAIKHRNKKIFGLQFHPENFVDETEGDEVFNNLLVKIF